MDHFKIAFFDAKSYDKNSFNESLKGLSHAANFSLEFIEPRLSTKTVHLANGCQGVCCFVNDHLNPATVDALAKMGVKAVFMRCAGFDRVDLQACKQHDISVMRVPAYSPYAVAEFAIASFLTLNRKLHRSFNRVRDHDFTLSGLVGFDLHGKTFGVVGTGKIGQCLIDIVLGFGCHVLAHDLYPSDLVRAKPNTKYVDLDFLLQNSDVISLHAPLNPDTRHMINKETIARFNKGAYLINTSRGGLVDTEALVEGLNSGQVGGAALDVYEHEANFFFRNCSDETISDPVLSRLCNLKNVLLTSHQAFLTAEALTAIANTTLLNMKEYFIERKKTNQLTNKVL